MAGIDSSSYIGKVDPNKVKLFISKTQKTATKSKLIIKFGSNVGVETIDSNSPDFIFKTTIEPAL